MTTELLKQARDALAKSEPTGIYKNSMTAAKRHENLIKEIDAALAQPADEDAWLKEAEKLADDHARATAWKHADNSTDESIDLWLQAKIALRAHLRTRPAREGFVSVPIEPTVDMINAGQCGCMDNDVTVCIWEAMIAAAKGGGK